MPKRKKLILAVVFGLFFLPTLLATVAAEEIVLKVLAINPSKDREQEVPIKTYLPAEAKPEAVLNRDEVKIGFDTDKSLYYVEKNVKLKPGQSYTLQVRMEDVWVIPQEDLDNVQTRADQAIEPLKDTYAYEVGKILYDNVLQTLKIIAAHQSSIDQLPQEHIANYRLDLKLIDQANKDLASLEAMSKSPDGMRKISASGKTKDGKNSSSFGSVSFSWKIILGVVGFLAVLSFVSFFLWQGQLKNLSKVKQIDVARTKFRNPENLTAFLKAEEMGQDQGKLQALYKDAEEMSRTDDLTKLNNRRHFFEILRSKIATAEVSKQVFYLVIFDVDNFKKINDKYGHLFGDEVIASVAQAAKQNTRPSDQLGRYGGDEFIITFDQTENMEIVKNVTRISNAIRALPLSANNEPVKLTASFGVAKFEPGMNLDEKKLIEVADKELLNVKRTQRGAIGIAGG